MLNEKSTALARIDNANTDWEVLDLPDKTKFTSITLRSQYRKLAILVHPDKNDDVIAPRCFVKLQHAYESLLKLTEEVHTSSSGNKSDTQEREGAFNEKNDHKPKRKRFHAPDLSTEAKFQAFNEISGDDDLEFHSHSWKKFCGRSNTDNVGNNTQPVGTVPVESNVPTSNSHDEPLPGTESTPFTPILSQCCLLCRRQFTSLESLKKHIDHSAMHQTNLSKSKLL